MARYHYYDLEGQPCRIEQREDHLGKAELYKPGHGFAPTPRFDVETEGKPISKAEFEARVLALVREGKAAD